MLRHLTPLSLVAILALSGPVLAQDSTAPTDDGQATTETPATGAENQLDLGQPADGSPKVGQRYSKETHGDWELACIKTQADTDPCSMLQTLTDDSGNAVAEVSMFRIENGGQAVAGATVVVPLETLLPAQLTIGVGDGPGKRYNYSFCNQVGCIAQIGLTQEEVDSFKKGVEAIVTLVPAVAPDQKIALKMSLSGFTAAFENVDIIRQ